MIGDNKMANKKVDTTEKMRDYYSEYQLDPNMKTKDIYKELQRKSGELRSQMANGSLNDESIQQKLQFAFNSLAEAIKIFKKEDRRKEYDLKLETARQANMIDMEAQKLAQDLYEELLAMFAKGNYNGVLQRCMEALNRNIRDYRLYILMAQSYMALNNPDNSIKTIDNGLQVHPDNMPLLRAGARLANTGMNDFDKSQQYINRMMEIDSENNLAVSEQSYLYLTNGKQDLAYQLVDEYMEKHPNDMDFRKNCAYDMIGYSYSSCYTKDPDNGAAIIASQENYQKCLDTCNKAVSLYNDETTKTALDNAKYFGTVEFNDENKKSIIWLFIGGVLYAFGGIMQIVTGAVNQSAGIWVACLVMFALAGLLIYSGIRLRQFSYRPYWQINKFILTGKREKGEGKYILIGQIFAGYMEWGLKISWKLIKFSFKLAFHLAS